MFYWHSVMLVGQCLLQIKKAFVMGTSLVGVHAPRAAAFEKRISDPLVCPGYKNIEKGCSRFINQLNMNDPPVWISLTLTWVCGKLSLRSS